MTIDKPIPSERNESDASSPGPRKGFVLPTVMFSVAVMSIVVVAAINTASDERRSSRATREATLALYAAEGGLRQTYGSWPSVAVKALNPGDSLNLGWQTLPNHASYRAVIHRLDNGGLQEYNVVVQGRRTLSTGGVATILGVVGGIPLLTYGVFSKTDISLAGGGTFNSYDSEVAPYTAATADTNATLWSNGNMDIQKTTISGDVSAAGTISYGPFSVVNGESNPGMDPQPEMDINACPAGGYTPAAQIPTGVGITYDPIAGTLLVAGGSTLTLTGMSYYFSRLIVAGNAQLVINPPVGKRTEIVVSDSLNTSGGSVSNLPGQPTRLGFSACGSPVPAKTWLFAGGSGAAFSVYAPNHPVTLAGGGEFFGAVVASKFTAKGGAKFHYDEALARLASEKLIVQKGTWSMLPGS